MKDIGLGVLLTIALLLSGMSLYKFSGTNSKDSYKAVSCDRYGCLDLSTFRNELECMDFTHSIVHLHTKILKDKPERVLRCVKQ